MTSQQRADEWLAVWRALGKLGYAPAARDAVIQREVDRYHEARFLWAMEQIRADITIMRHRVTFDSSQGN